MSNEKKDSKTKLTEKNKKIIKEKTNEVVIIDDVKRRKDKGSFFKRYKNSLLHALDGINYTIEKEHNMIGIMLSAILFLILSVLLPLTLIETIIVVILISLLLVTELINTSIEATVDLITTKENKLAKVAKDTASSAMFITIFIYIVINAIIFIPKIADFIVGIM